MTSSSTDSHRHDRLHGPLFVVLTLVLVVFAGWCVLLWLEVQPLRHALARHLTSGESLQQIRWELESPHQPVSLSPRAVEEARRAMEQLGRDHDGAEWRLAISSLETRLAELTAAAPPPTQGESWDASLAALSALNTVDALTEREIAELHARLGERWSSLNLLVIASLVLAASNLGLVHLAHRRRRQLEAAHAEALSLSSHDSLTGLWHREAILNLLRHELARARRIKVPLGLVLADIDNFRQINELLGQDQGDTVLRQIARRLQSLVRPYDTLGRFGGDSFLVVLPSCDDAATAGVAERLRRAVDEEDVEHAFGHAHLTLSVARLTVTQAEEVDLDSLLRSLRSALAAAHTPNRAIRS